MTKKTLALSGFVALFPLVGCGGSPLEGPRTPVNAGKTAEPNAAVAPGPQKSSVWTLPDGPRDKQEQAAEPKEVSTAAWAKASKVKGLPPPPATCASFAKPAGVKPALPEPSDESQPWPALAEKDPAKRNAAMFAVELAKPELAPIVRVMRADLGPIECGDAVLDPSITSAPMAAQTAIGLSLAAKLSRTASSAPTPKDASNKEALKKFIQGPLRAWMVEQAAAIDGLSVPAGELFGLARGIVAIEAGTADLRLVDRIRSAPTPSTWDKELKAVYEAALDEALEPRKTRGRDAALVGLADFASAGIVRDARVDRARGLLSKLYGGRRIDALDGLLLPPEANASTEANKTAHETALALVPKGAKAFAPPLLPPPPRATTARDRFEMGRTYWRQVDFVEAAHLAAAEPSPNKRLVLAIALSLARGPKNAREMMAAPSPSSLGLGNTDALDELAAHPEEKTVAGLAAFDAAHLRSLSAPEGAAAATHFADVAARFEKAASLLEDPAHKKLAQERAAAASAIAKAAAH
jgi:hypothetical protein